MLDCKHGLKQEHLYCVYIYICFLLIQGSSTLSDSLCWSQHDTEPPVLQEPHAVGGATRHAVLAFVQLLAVLGP